MQAENSQNASNFPTVDFFLPDDYDSDDFLEYDLIEDEDIDSTVDEEDVIVEDEGDVKVRDETNNNLWKRKRKRSKKILLQTDIDKLWNKLHANKYFMEEITPELVCCKCGKEIRLDRKFRDKNLIILGELSGCKYIFFHKNK